MQSLLLPVSVCSVGAGAQHGSGVAVELTSAWGGTLRPAAGISKFIPVQRGERRFHAYRVLVFKPYQFACLHPEMIKAGTFARQTS